MSKISLNKIGSIANNPVSAQTAINNNNDTIVTAFDNTLSRDGSAPNQMGSSIDMNSNAILNLPKAVDPTSPVRLQEIGDAPGFATAAAASATAAAASATSAATSATAAAASATSASASATAAQNYVVGLSGTSSTSVTIGTGSKSFTANTGKVWATGQMVTLTSNANSANYMHGSITSYNSGTGSLVVNVLDIGGSGTLADWNITISGTQGPQGATGATGPSGAVGVSGTPTANQFATWNSSTVIQGVSITGLVKGNGASAPTAAVSGTDYAPATSGTAILKGNGSGGFANAAAGTDYMVGSNNLSELTNTTTARSNLGVPLGTSGATVPLLNGKNTWTNVQSPTPAALTSGSAADFTTNQIWTANVNGGTFTISNPSSNPPTGSIIGISVTFTTANSLAFGTNFKTTGYTASTSGKDFLTFYWNGTTYELVGLRNATNS